MSRRDGKEELYRRSGGLLWVPIISDSYLKISHPDCQAQALISPGHHESPLTGSCAFGPLHTAARAAFQNAIPVPA